VGLGVLCAWLLYRGSAEQRGWGRGLVWTLGAARALAIALLAFFLLEPMVRVWEREVRKPVVVIAHDGSASLLAAGDTTALRATYRPALEKLAADLGERFDVRGFSYGGEVREGLSFDQDQGHTDIDALFRAVRDRLAGPDLGAVIVDGDGIYNRGRDPRLAAERLAVPVYTIALGDTTVRPDLILKNVEHNRITYLGNEFPLLVRVAADHLAGRRSVLTVKLGDRTVGEREVVVSRDPFITEVPLLIKATDPGLQRYSVALRAVEGEANASNNRLDIYIDVLDDRQRILLLAAAPHPDVAAVRSALDRLEGYATEVAYAATYTGDVAENDLVVLVQLPGARGAIQPVVQRILQRGIPTLVLHGQQTDVRQLAALDPGVAISNVQRSFTEAQAGFNKDFTLFTLEPEDVRAIERFPPLQVPFGQYDAARSAVSLFQQRVGVVRTAYPLIAFDQQGERRTAIVCGEGLWRWRLADQQQNGSTARFDRLVQKIATFLALKADRSRFRVQHAPEFAENEPVTLTAELYNKSYEPVNTPEAAVTLKDEDGRDYAYSFIRSGSGYRLEAGVLAPGRYTWKATTALDGEPLTAAGELLVKPMVAERMSTVADHRLWADIAARTNGLAVGPGDLGLLADSLTVRKELVARSYAHASFNDLINLKALFFILLGLLVLEWALRRRNGAY
jgi:hypothetical protein